MWGNEVFILVTNEIIIRIYTVCGNQDIQKIIIKKCEKEPDEWSVSYTEMLFCIFKQRIFKYSRILQFIQYWAFESNVKNETIIIKSSYMMVRIHNSHSLFASFMQL